MKEPKEFVSNKEMEEQEKLFSEINNIASSVRFKGAIIQNRGIYYSNALDEFDGDIEYLIGELQEYQKGVHEFHKKYDPEHPNNKKYVKEERIDFVCPACSETLNRVVPTVEYNLALLQVHCENCGNETDFAWDGQYMHEIEE